MWEKIVRLSAFSYCSDRYGPGQNTCRVGCRYSLVAKWTGYVSYPSLDAEEH